MLKLRLEVGKVATMADNGNSITLYTPELSPEQMTELFALKKDGECIGAFESLGRKTQDLTNVDKPVDGKSKSQRLRSVLYVLWEQEHQSSIHFDAFYDQSMEKLINSIKDKLN